MNILQKVYSWTVLICLSMPKQNVCFLNLKLQRDMNIFQFQMLQSSTMFWLQKSWLQSLQLNSFMNCISMPMPKQNLCCICKAFFIITIYIQIILWKHNCHIGMASFHHELLVSVLRKTMRFYSFLFFMCFDINLKTVFKSVQLSKGVFIINDFLRNPLEQNYFEDGYQSLQNSIHNSRIRCYTTSVPIPMILVNSTLTI